MILTQNKVPSSSFRMVWLVTKRNSQANHNCWGIPYMNTYGIELGTVALGLLLARVVIGLVMAAHGAQKLFGWFGGYGLNKTG